MGYWPAGKGWGDRDEEVTHPPSPADAKTQRGRNREAGRPASCPAHSSSSYRFYRSATETGETGLQAINYKLVQGRKGRRRCLQPQVEIPALSRTGPRASSMLGAEPSFSPHLRGEVAGQLPLWAARFPICQPRGWTRSHLGIVPTLVIIIITTTVTRVSTW